jgi:hypothetical protein
VRLPFVDEPSTQDLEHDLTVMLEMTNLTDEMDLFEVLDSKHFKVPDYGECPEDGHMLNEGMRDCFEWFGWVMKHPNVKEYFSSMWDVPTLHMVQILLKGATSEKAAAQVG